MNRFKRSRPTAISPGSDAMHNGAGLHKMLPKGLHKGGKVRTSAGGIGIGGGNRKSRSISTQNLPDINSIQINRPSSLGGAKPIKKLNKNDSMPALNPALKRQNGQIKPLRLKRAQNFGLRPAP